jgi:hypothetical protein
LRELIEDGLRDPHNPIFDFLEFSAVQKLLDTYYRNGPTSPAQIWCLLMLHLWFREVHAVSHRRDKANWCLARSA